MATITVCPPDTIEALEAALPVVWIGEPAYLDKLARETVAGLNQPPPCDDAIGDDGEEECASCQALGSWEEEGALAYPLCPTCKAQAAEEAREAEVADWIRTPAPFGGEE